MSLQTYNKVKVIGKGSYGEVWLVKHKKDKKQYVLKKLELQNASKRERRAAEQEAKLLSRLKHPNIVSYKDSFQDDVGYLFIAMGFCEGGDLYGRLKEQKGRPLDERQVVEWFVQIAMALQYMHERNILHRDLKTQNIFLTKSKIIKVGDLGIARVLDSSCDMATTLIGTPYYMSPELFSNKPYNHKSDVWALGCCVYEMATLKHAFNAKDMNSLVYKILRGKMPQMPRTYSPALVQLIKAMLNQNPERRPSVNRILRDPYIKKNIAIFLEGTKKSRSRPGSSGSSRRTPDSSRRGEDVLDSAARSGVSSASKVKQRPPPVVELEPLQVGPDLEPIKEEEDISGDKSHKQSKQKQKLSSESPKRSERSKSPRMRSKSRSPVPDRRNQQRLPPRPKGHVRTGSDPMFQPNKAESPKVSRRRIVSDNKMPLDSPLGSEDLSANSQESVKSSDQNQKESSSSRPRPLKKKKKRVVDSSSEPEPIVISVDSVDEEVLRKSSSTKSNNKVHNNSGEFGFVLDANSKPVLKKVTSEPVISNARQIKDRDSHRRNSAQDENFKQPRAFAPSPSTSARDPQPSSSSCRNLERESGYGSASSYSASRDDAETPRPNTARARRREKKELETPRTSRSVDLEKNRKSVDFVSKNSKYRSEDYSSNSGRGDKAQIIDLEGTDGFDPVPESQLKSKKKAQAIGSSVSSSSDDEEDPPEEIVKEKEKKRSEKEMNNFISLLDTTLKLDMGKDDDDNISRPPGINGATYVKGPAPRKYSNSNIPVIAVEDTLTEDDSPMETPSHNPEFSYERGTGMLNVPAGRTMTTTGRLWERITVLRKDCIRGLGVEKLKRAYDVLDNIENDEVEPKLIQVLGRDQFELYAGKIWQLKFCEEAAFGMV